MKRSTLLGALALLTVVCLGVATFALVRRHAAEARVAELKRLNQVPSAGRPAAQPVVNVAHPVENQSKAASPVPTATDEKANPDIGQLFASHPELQSAYRRAVTGRLHQTYGRFFGRLGLSTAQIDQAVALLALDSEHELDLAMAAQALQLPKDDPAVRQFRRGEKSDTEAGLQSLLGPQGMAAWRDYNRALGMQSTAEDVASFTLATATPMTGAQKEQLTRVLAEASTSYREGKLPEWSTTDWAEVLRQASQFLAPAQVAALQAKIDQAKAASLLPQFYASRAQPDGRN